MPVFLPPFSRRRFLAGSLAAGLGLAIDNIAHAEDRAIDPNRFALMADTHIAADREAVVRGAHMFDHLRQTGDQIAALANRPQAAIVNGDCAYLSGESDDYAVLVELLAPIRAAGVPVHLTLGNHDHRERFWQAIPSGDPGERPVVNRHISVIDSPHANWYLLDSLEQTNHTPGKLGQQQLAWLDQTLAARKDKPALVVAHHNPDVRDNITGLTDTAALFEVLRGHRQVKAYFFGHTHNWDVRPDQDGIHLVNLPPVAYVFGQGNPSGWVDVKLAASGASLQLKCLDPDHPKHDQIIELTWRS